MNPLTYAYGVLASAMAALIGPGGVFNGARIGLITDVGALPQGTTLSGVHQATYDGYALSPAVTWGTVHTATDGTVRVAASSVEFKPTDGLVSCTVTQAILTDPTGTHLLASYVLPQPVNFATKDDVEVIVFELVMDSVTSGLVGGVAP